MPDQPRPYDPPVALQIDARFAGPPGSANGGYTAGRLAALLPAGAAVEVTLRQPPPLETRLDVSVSGDRASLRFGGVVIADRNHLREAGIRQRPRPIGFGGVEQRRVGRGREIEKSADLRHHHQKQPAGPEQRRYFGQTAVEVRRGSQRGPGHDNIVPRTVKALFHEAAAAV